MSQKQYWKGLEELENNSEHQKIVDNEFPQELTEISEVDSLLSANTPRRDFLKFLGFSTLAATVAASCEMPVRKAIPYAIQPDAESIKPGVPNYYASSFIDNGDYCAVVVKTRDGRPIMVEGNKLSSISKGGSTARAIASTLSLYDVARLRGPHINGEAADTFEAVDTPIKQGLTSTTGQIVLLTGTLLSPTSKDIIKNFLVKYPNAKHIQYDPVSYSGMILANEVSFGKKAIPSYNFDKAKTIFSLAADFLGTWLSPGEFSHGYVKNRKVTKGNTDMSKHYQVEGMLSLTGANADERATAKPSEYGKVAAALYQAVVNGTTPNFTSAKLNNLIVKAAKDLKANNGLVVCGSNDMDVQIVVNAINNAINAYGNTINWAITSNYKQGDDRDMVALVAAMNAGQVGALVVHGVNPAYDYYNAEQFKTGIAKVKLTVSFNDRLDETTQLCTYAVPDNHWLESWGDAEPKTGHISFIQPTIAPLFKTRAFQDSLLVWAGDAETYHDYWNAYWVNKLGQTNFDKALQDGILEYDINNTNSGAYSSSNLDAAITAVNNSKGSAFEIIVYEKVGIGYGGAWSNNPWLLEMPDPITKATWDNYVMMSPKTAKEKFNAELTGLNQVDPKKRVVTLKVGTHSVDLPVVVIPGMHNDVIAVAVGFGRDKGVGRAAADLGVNVYPLVTYSNNSFHYTNAVEIQATENTYPVAITQTHHSYENRPIIYEYTLDQFKNDPFALIKTRKSDLQHYVSNPWEKHEEGEQDLSKFDAKKFEEDFEKHGTLYPVHDKPGLKWGMSIDLSACTGCGACVVACQAENNISVVGKSEVLKAQEMHWLRIDRYFSGDPNDPDSIQAVFQPMLCQHCDNAPCENVCPVNATNHSQEGLNQMAYNRCIGTKYCANNCPYKVRRFNWYDFNGADSFKDNLFEDGRRDDINDDLTRMVLNPDVTVRSRGVMEKCSFCVQRLQAGKLEAKIAGETLKDHHVSTACQRACAGDCITFGNVHDKESEIYKLRYEDNKERVFYVLEQLHILPNVNYLSKIRNTDEIVAGGEKDGIYQQHI